MDLIFIPNWYFCGMKILEIVIFTAFHLMFYPEIQERKKQERHILTLFSVLGNWK